MKHVYHEPGVVVEVRDCKNCDGRGMLIGPFDEELGDRIIRDCSECRGMGIKIIRRKEPKAKPA